MKKIIMGIFSALFLSLIAFPAQGKDCMKAEKYVDKALALENSINIPLILIKKELLYRRAIELCPSNAQAHNNLGNVYENQRRYEEAISEYKRAIELMPTAYQPYFGLGDIYAKTNRPSKAIKWYEKGLKYAPNDTLTNKRIALVKNIQKGGLIRAETIRGMLSTISGAVRGAGEVVSLTFGEGLIPFDYNKYDIRDDAKAQLDEIGKALAGIFVSSRDITIEKKEHPIFVITGHTDIRGTDKYNLELSKKRAESVTNYIVEKFNIPRDRLVAEGYGERAPLCTSGKTEACHALNRRVEIMRKQDGDKPTRTAALRGIRKESEIAMDVGFFFQKKGESIVRVMKEGIRLRSGSDKYFFFLRPDQDCYVYILQEDAKGEIDLIFPSKGKDAHLKKGGDYWVPGFGKAFSLDDTKGEEKLYLLVTSWPLEAEIVGMTLEEQVRGAIRSVRTRAIYVVRPPSAPESIPEYELDKKTHKLDQLLETIRGREGWVKVVKFIHE